MTAIPGLRSRALGLALQLAAIVAAIVTQTGGPTVPLWLVALLALYLGLRSLFSSSTALPAAITIFLVLELFLLRVNPLVQGGLSLSETVCWTALSSAIAIATIVKAPQIPRLSNREIVLGTAATAGSIVLVATAFLAQIIPGALKIAWAMNGDTVNVISFARRMLIDGGIDSGSTPQPTPLPFAMVASNMSSGRLNVSPGDLLEHDVYRAIQVWMLAVALTCLLAGVIVARMCARIRLWVSVPIVIGSSFIGLNWFVLGVQLQFGFLNSSFAVLLLLGAWLLYASGQTRPWTSLGFLLLTGLAMLAVWSPLIVCIAALGIAMTVVGVATARNNLRRDLAFPVLCAVLFAIYAVTVTLPGFVHDVTHLGGEGGFPNIGPASALSIACVTGILACLTASVTRRSHASIGAIALLVSVTVGLAYLLLQRLGNPTLWGYYPAKFAWTVSILLLVVGVSLAAKTLSQHPPQRFWDYGLVLMTAALFAGLLWSPASQQRPHAQVPVWNIIRGNAFGLSNEVAEKVFELSGSETEKHVLWKTTMGDFWPNFWLLQTDIPDPNTNPVRSFAHYANGLTAEDVCSIVTLLGPKTVVHTSDPDATDELAAACPDGTYRVQFTK